MTPDPKQECSKRSWEGQMKSWRRRLHFWTPEEQKEDEKFYENPQKDAEIAPTVSELRPLPEVVLPTTEVEPMQLNGENSLLGKWAENSNSMAMELQGDSCNPAAFQEKKEEMLFIPFQFE
jgi:hypothetical protein